MNFFTTALSLNPLITRLDPQAFESHISIRAMVSYGENCSGHCSSFYLFVFIYSYLPFVFTLSLLLLISLSRA